MHAQAVEDTPDGPLYAVRGVSDFVKETTASFYSSLDEIAVLAPEDSTVVADTSPRYRRTRLWIESTLRKTPVPVDHAELTVSTQMLADDLPYQREAVEMALDPERIHPRLLIADAVGLGKTLEIGMILSELIRRGRGRRILFVCPRHVLEQMQHELWTRFTIPFVRLDSEGVQQVKQQLPASRNPFTFFEKVIISIDTLKQDRFVYDLRHHRWDAVVIDESRPGMPLRRPGDAREVAAVIDFLASPRAPYVTDASWVVDGGMVQMGPQGAAATVDDAWRHL